MKFSFSLVPSYQLSRYVDVVAGVTVERGFDQLWVPDQGFHRDPFVALAAVASQLKRMELGIAVTNFFTRHPVQVARAAAALGELHPRGIALGLGAGERRVRDAIGADRGRFVEVTRDGIVAMRRLLAGETVSMKNEAFAIEGVKLEFAPSGHVSFYVASTTRSAFRMAGAVADGVIVGDVADPEAMRSVIAEVHAGAREAGRNPDDVSIVSWTTTICTEDAPVTFELMRRRLLPSTIGTMSEYSRSLVGVDQDTFAAVSEAFKQRTPISASALDDQIIDRVALVGSATRIAERLRALEAVGVDRIGMRMPGALLGLLDLDANLMRLSNELMPMMRPAAVGTEGRHDR